MKESGSWKVRELFTQAEELEGQAQETLSRAGQEIRRVRESRGKSLRELARELGVSPQFLSDIEHGRRKVTRRLVDRLLEGGPEPTESTKPESEAA